MNKQKLERYATLKQLEKSTQEEIAKLMPEIVIDMTEAGADKIKSDFGTFSLGKRKIWKYTPAVERAKEIMESIKKDEEASGAAIFEERSSLIFTSKKDKENEV